LFSRENKEENKEKQTPLWEKPDLSSERQRWESLGCDRYHRDTKHRSRSILPRNRESFNRAMNERDSALVVFAAESAS
jgi:hypothetical protein